jgi:glycosyltransferase involved in cell wall biosynthesis
MSSPSAIDALLRDYAGGEYFSRLLNHPTPHVLRQPPVLVYSAVLSGAKPRFTIVMPTFNHESNIEDVLDAAARSASLPFACIIVDDGSEDATVERATSFLESRRSPLVAAATIIRNPIPSFETACDNLGFALADTELIVELQADIQIREPAFDALFLRAGATSPKPSAISGRCGHTFTWLKSGGFLRSLLRRPAHESVGLCGKAIETPEAIDSIKGQIYRCETVNRGPWMVFKSDLERHGYLDERHFFLGNDDHDYHRRLFSAEGRRPLYVPMSLSAPLALGVRRRPRTGVNRDVFNLLKTEKRGSPAFHDFINSLTASHSPDVISG